METTEYVYQKAEEMNKSLQKVIIEYQRRISSKILTFQITALKIESNGAIFLAGDSSGRMYRAEIKNLAMQILDKCHDGSIQAICPLADNEFLSGGDDGKLVLWRHNQLFQEKSLAYPVTSMVSYENHLWVFSNTNIAVHFRLNEFGFTNEKFVTFTTENPRNIQPINNTGSVSLLYHTKDSVDIWSAKGLFVSESHKIDQILTFCVLKETKGISIWVNEKGIYIWYYGLSIGKYFYGSEGDWDHFLSLDRKILVSIGRQDKRDLIKFWNEETRTCIIEIFLACRVVTAALSKDEQYLLLSLQDISYTR